MKPWDDLDPKTRDLSDAVVWMEWIAVAMACHIADEADARGFIVETPEGFVRVVEVTASKVVMLEFRRPSKQVRTTIVWDPDGSVTRTEDHQS